MSCFFIGTAFRDIGSIFRRKKRVVKSFRLKVTVIDLVVRQRYVVEAEDEDGHGHCYETEHHPALPPRIGKAMEFWCTSSVGFAGLPTHIGSFQSSNRFLMSDPPHTDFHVAHEDAEAAYDYLVANGWEQEIR